VLVRGGGESRGKKREGQDCQVVLRIWRLCGTGMDAAAEGSSCRPVCGGHRA
jgi:hypothetical protein